MRKGELQEHRNLMSVAGSERRVLVTGATGLLGSHIAERLVARGYRVRALVRPRSRTGFLEGLGVEIQRETSSTRPTASGRSATLR